MSKSGISKSLKGPGLDSNLTRGLEDSIFAAISGGSILFDNVEITSGTINGTTIGNDTPGPGTFTTLQTGNPSGQGFQVCFYGQSPGDSACWEPVIGRWNIQGDLLVRDISDLGNFRIASNTLSSTNLNGNITIDPAGTGSINLTGPVIQTAVSGNVSFSPSNGNFTVNTGNIIQTTSQKETSLRTNNGDIYLQTGNNIIPKNITFITTSSTPTITTSTPHLLSIGDTINISGTNSVPNIDGTRYVTDVVSTTSFRISPGFSVSSVGTSGVLTRHNDIYLNATNNVNIPQGVKLVLGDDDVYIKSGGGGVTKEIVINSTGDILLNPGINKDVIIPDNISLSFGNTTRKIESDGTDIILSPGIGTFIVDGNIRVNGTSTAIHSEITTIKDPVITLGTNIIDDNKDRGIEFKYNNGVSQKTGFFGFDDSTGCFTVIPDAVNNNEVFSGNPGCINVGAITATSINLQGGSINNIGTFNVCDIFCPNNLSITGGNSITFVSPTVNLNGDVNNINGSVLNITSSNTYISDPVLSISKNNVSMIIPDLRDRGIEFSYYDDFLNTSANSFFGWDNSINAFTFYQNITNNNEVISGTLGNAVFGDTTVNDLVVNGTISANFVKTTEHLTFQGNTTGNITKTINISFISVISIGITTGVLENPLIDGFEKYILCSSLVSGSEYHLVCPSGILLDSGSGTTLAKKIKFDTPGQSLYIIWDNVLQRFLAINNNACVSEL